MILARPFSRLFNTFSQTPQTQLVSKNFISNDAIKELHAHLIRTQQHTGPSSMSHVIRSYALSPANLRKALLAFDEIERPTLPIWNFLIRGLSQSDSPIDAIHLFDKMRDRGLACDNLTLIYILTACARVSDTLCGQKVHVQLMKLRFESYLYVCNMYGSCGDLGFARKVFGEMSDRDLVSWNSLICGFCQCNRLEEVLGLFDEMQAENVKADSCWSIPMSTKSVYAT